MGYPWSHDNYLNQPFRALLRCLGLPSGMPSGSAHTMSLQQMMRQADTAYANDDWQLAAELCAQALHSQADYVPALSLLGIIRAQAGHPDEAAELLKRVATAMPENPMAHNNYGNVLRDLRRFQDARASYDRAIELEPGYAEAYNNRGAALAALKLHDAALDSYSSAGRLRADYAEAHYNRGITLYQLGRVNEALESYTRAVAIQPQFAEALYNQGIALQDLRHLEAAVGSYRAAIKAKPSFAQAHNNLGAVLRDLGYTNEALDCFARALEINPALVEAYLNRGHTLAVLMRPEEALASYDVALKFMPERPWLYGAWLYAKMQLCDWTGMQGLIAGLTSRVNAGRQTAQAADCTRRKR